MHTTDPHGAHGAHAQGPGHELSDAKVRPLVESGVLLVVLCLASFWGMVWVHDWLKAHEQKKSAIESALTATREVPPAPHLETAPHMPTSFGSLGVDVIEGKAAPSPFKHSGLVDVRVEEDERLASYGWVDQQAKLVHIPIEQAMQKLLEKGVPTRK